MKKQNTLQDQKKDYNSTASKDSLKMGYISGPSGKTDNPILKSTQEIKGKGTLPPISSNG